ncbi:MAG TPA: MBL fold metallo-hydrolase [Aggregatilineaceae bacterium]|nr:MBL fold metallo-hydrolase [Aggregatilineaceae bacterium]
MIDRIQWLGHGSFRIEGSPLTYINPWRIARSAFHADLILISSDQYEHCSPADVEKLCGPDTVVVANAEAAAALGGDVVVLRPWQCFNVGAARITAVPAYTYSHHHPVSQGGLGFIISLGYYDIYYAGLTDVVPELMHIRADIAILPVGAGQGTMNTERAADFVRQMQPSHVIPSHWGTISGTNLDVQAFVRALDGQTNVMAFEKNR